MVKEAVLAEIDVHWDYDYIFELEILQNKTMKYSRSRDSATSGSGIKWMPYGLFYFGNFYWRKPL